MIKPEKLSLKASDSVVAHIKSFWSPSEDSNVCPANGANINSVVMSTVR